MLQWTNGRSRKNKGRRSPQLLGDSLITPPAKDDDMEHLKQNSQVRLVSSPAPLAHRLSVRLISIFSSRGFALFINTRTWVTHLRCMLQASKANQDGLLNGRLTSNGAQSHTSSSSLEDDNQGRLRFELWNYIRQCMRKSGYRRMPVEKLLSNDAIKIHPVMDNCFSRCLLLLSTWEAIQVQTEVNKHNAN